MREKDFQKKFSRWLRHNNHETAVYELKATPGMSIPWSAVALHQVEALTHANDSFIVYKLPDEGIGQKPFDCFKLVTVAAYIGIIFQCKENSMVFYLIKVQDFLQERLISDRKSLTEQRANDIGTRYHFNEAS